MSSINNIPINSQTIKNCYERYYKDSTFSLILDKNYFHYLHLFGIRVSTGDSSQPDDFLGGFRVTNLNFFESVVGAASLEPSPQNLTRYFDAEAKAKGGAAFIREGQHTFRYMGRNFNKFAPLPSFCPVVNNQIKGAKVYRFLPEQPLIDAWRKDRKPPLSASFDAEYQKLKSGKPSRAKLSESTDVCIHKSWSKTNFVADSAGCSITPDSAMLTNLGNWADAHIKKKFGNIFTYTVFTKEQFLTAQKEKAGTDFLRFLPRINLQKLFRN